VWPGDGLDEDELEAMMRRVAFGALALSALTASSAHSQTLTGRVARDNVPVVGALVLVVDAGGRVVARTASRDLGEYSVVAAPGSYRVQVLQIGWRPTIAGPFTLSAGAVTRANIDATGTRILLDPIIVTDRSEWRVRPGSAAAAFGFWGEARKALIAALMTSAEPMTMTLKRTEQELDRSGTHVNWDTTRIQSGRSLRPFASLPPETLARDGYVSTDPDSNKTYWGPDADVLLSESFLSSHCIRTVRPSAVGDSVRLIGVGFSPSNKRKNLVDVEGVLWLDRTTAELRAMDYHYVNTSKVVEESKPGGHLAFLKVLSGRWIVEQWSIRVPSTATRVLRGEAPTVPGAQRIDTQREELANIRLTSGQVTEIRRGTDVLWERGRVNLVVEVVDSTTSRPVRGVLVRTAESRSAVASDSLGRVRLDRIPPGSITIRLESPMLESIGRSPFMVPVTVASTNDATISIPIPSERATVASRCGERSLEWGEGMLRGRIESLDSTSRAPVTISWKTSYARLGGGEAVAAEEKREIRLAADGSFEVCGVPRDATVTLVRTGEATPLATGQFAPGALAASVVVRR
jgi:hypothetical protein